MEDNDLEIVAFLVAMGLPREDAYAMAQAKADELHKRVNKGQKAHFWVCHPLRPEEGPELRQYQKLGKCYKCKGRIVYDPAHKSKMRWNCKKICKLCMLKHHRDKIHPEHIKYLEAGLD